ncbi:MAG: High-affinity branched-chain amino acid transport system permease protein LivH [Anaerolineae bacterium]|nr:High-affinity branched-chain amino acid transport system permease protein LivH [Anaerolineae bacterium]
MHLPSLNVLTQVVVIGLLTGGVYALMAAGLTLIFGVMRVINIAHGAFLVLSAYIAYWLFNSFGLDPFLSVIVSVPLLFVIGYVFQSQLLAKLRNEPGLVVLLTFSIALTLEGVMGVIWQSTGRSIRTWYTSQVWPVTLGDITLRLPVVRVVGFFAAIIALVLLYLLISRSDLGRAIRATVQNKDAAQLVGVNVARVQAVTFGIGLATVAGGGAIFSLIWTFNAGSHEEWISKMLAVIVLGGMGSLPGAFVAALLMGMAESTAAVMMSSYISPIVFYLILFLTLIFRPQGLMGTIIRKG